MVALVVATSEASAIGIGAPVRTAATNALELVPLALVLAAASLGARLRLRPDQTVGLAEVVQPGAAAAAGDVQRLLGEARVAAGDVG